MRRNVCWSVNNNSLRFYLQLEDYKVAQKEQESQIEKEIIKKEKDISHLKQFRSRCVEIVSIREL